MAPAPGPLRPPGPLDQPGLDLQAILANGTKGVADTAIEGSTAGWLARADDNQKIALIGLAAAAAIGPAGQGILAALGALFKSAAVPSGDQLMAVTWLLVITAPVAAWCFVFALAAGRGSFASVLAIAGVAAYLGGVLLASLGIPAQLGDLYCFASFTPAGVEYEHACRAFDALGFLGKAAPYLGSPSGSAKIAEWAMVYVADARGSAMALAGILAGLSAGYLVRRES